jgi:hypothetical protein
MEMLPLHQGGVNGDAGVNLALAAAAD